MEILIVTIILGLLAALVVPRFFGRVEHLTVTAERGAKVRAGPATTYQVLTAVPRSTVLPILKTSQGWYKVRIKDGRKGWIAAWIVQVEKKQRDQLWYERVAGNAINLFSSLGPFFSIKDRTNAEETYGKGVRLALSDDFDGAIAAFTEALEQDPTFVAALVNRGNVQIAKLNYDAAFRDYADAIRMNPDGGEAYISRGQLYWLRGDLPGARADFEKVIELEPDNDFIHMQLAKVLGEMDRFKDIVKLYERAYRGDRRREWALWLWLTYLRLPDTYDRLLQTATKLRREGERSLAIEYNKGLVYHFRRNYRAAIPLLTKAIDNADPDFIESEAYAHLATAYRNIGRSDKCRERVDQYAKRFNVSEISYEGCIRRPWH